MDTNIPSTGFLHLPQILKLFPISKSAWWQGCRKGRYPQPVKLGPHTTVWGAEDIRELIQSVGNGKTMKSEMTGERPRSQIHSCSQWHDWPHPEGSA